MLSHTYLYNANLLVKIIKITQFKILHGHQITSIGKNTQRQDVHSIIDQSFKQIFTHQTKGGHHRWYCCDAIHTPDCPTLGYNNN